MWAVSDSIKRSWDEIIYFWPFGTLVQVSRICKEDSFSHQSFVSSQWHKILAAWRTKGWRDVLLIIRLLFIVPIWNVLKSISVAPCLMFGKYFENYGREQLLGKTTLIKHIDKVRHATKEKGPHSYKSCISA